MKRKQKQEQKEKDMEVRRSVWVQCLEQYLWKERERDTLKIKVKYQDLILRISGEYSKERYKFVTRNHQVGHLMRTLQQNSVIKISGNKSLHPITKMIP